MTDSAVGEPVSFLIAARTLLRLELSEARRSRWLVFTAICYAVVFSVFVWLGLRQSSVLGFTGLSRVVLNAASAIVLVLPLVCLVATCQAVVRARHNGYFEMFLTQPCSRSAWFAATVTSRVVVVLLPLVGLLFFTLVAGAFNGEFGVGYLIARTLGVSAALAWCFIGLGLLVSERARTPERAIVYALFVWLASSALHDFALIGLLLRSPLSPEVVFALAALNPVEAARLAMLSVVDPELGVFGPVGFWLANTFGPDLTFATGILWPLVLGSGALALATRHLTRTDLV